MAYGRGGQGKVDIITQGVSVATGASNWLGFIANFIKKARGDTLKESQKLNMAGVKQSDVNKYYKEPKDLAEQLIPDVKTPTGFVQKSRKAPTAPLSQANLLAGIGVNDKLATKIQNLIDMKSHTDPNLTKLLANAGLTPRATMGLSGPVTRIGSLKPKQSLTI